MREKTTIANEWNTAHEAKLSRIMQKKELKDFLTNF